MPVRYAGMERHTGEYLRKAQGLFPDLLKDIKDGKLRLTSGYWQALHFTIDL